MKVIPVLGTVVLIGAIFQVVFGFQVAGGWETLLWVHIIFGIVGLGLVVVLAAVAFRAKVATIYSKITMTILTLVVLAQVVLGFQVMAGAEALVTSHEMTGFLVVVLSLVVGGITFLTAKRRTRSVA